MKLARKLLFVLAILAAFLLAAPALADPGVGEWLDAGGTERTQVKAGSLTISYSFTTAVDSKLVKVVSPKADFCFDPDSASAAGDARITVRRVIIDATTFNSIAITVPFDETNCAEVVSGSYWVVVDTPRTSAETPVVSLTGRE